MLSAQKANGSELRSLPAISGESVKGGYSLSQSVMTNRNLPLRANGARGSFDLRREAPGGLWTGPKLVDIDGSLLIHAMAPSRDRST